MSRLSISNFAVGLLFICFLLFNLIFYHISERIGLISNRKEHHEIDLPLKDIIHEMGMLNSGLRVAPCADVDVCFIVVNNLRQKEDFNEQSSRCFDEVIYSLADSISRLGGSSCVRSLSMKSSFEQCSSAKHTVIFGSHLLGLKGHPLSRLPVPSHVIVYNMEQVGKSNWFKSNNNYYISLLQSNEVWEYSLENIKNLKSKKVSRLTHMPVGYARGLTVNTSPKEKDIDVLLVGTSSPRRCAVLKQINARGYRVVLSTFPQRLQSSCDNISIPPVFGQDYYTLINRAKILLNIHYFENVGVLEIVRISSFLANGGFVLSEEGSDQSIQSMIEGGIVTAPYSNLVDACMKYLADDESRQLVASKGQALIRGSQFDNTPHLRCQLFASPHLVNPGRNVFTHKPFPHIQATDSSIPQHKIAFLEQFTPPSCFRVVAIMAGYNEADTILFTVQDLLEQGVDVHFIDNWSTDNTQNVIKSLQQLFPNRVTVEVFPDARSHTYDWANILNRKTEVSKDIIADWFIHVDPDELRESPWGRQISLRTALYIADRMGYNLINFGNVLTFPPLKDELRRDSHSSLVSHFRTSFTHFSYNNWRGDSLQVKAWKSYESKCEQRAKQSNRKQQITPDLASHGGHIFQYAKSEDGNFPDHKLFPYLFFLRHYPIRSQKHGERKVFEERRKRWNETERSKDWHKQYETLKEGHDFWGDKRSLFRVLDNGDLPPHLLADSYPCL